MPRKTRAKNVAIRERFPQSKSACGRGREFEATEGS